METKIHSQSDDAQSLNEIFSLPRNERRRFAVAFLSGVEAPVSLDEIATAVAVWETETDADEVSSETCDDIALTLHHNHLPKLSEYEIVDYDTGTNMVTPT